MKVFLSLSTFLLLTLSSVYAQEPENFTLTVDIQVTKYNKGSVYLALYNSKETYMNKAYKTNSGKVVDNKATITLENIKKGDYAFSLFHDVNSNKKMDKNFIGIPKEPYGFSNNESGPFGPPKFEKVVFNINKSKTIKVHIK